MSQNVKSLVVGVMGAVLGGLVLIAAYQYYDTRELAKADHKTLATLCGRLDTNTRGQLKCD